MGVKVQVPTEVEINVERLMDLGVVLQKVDEVKKEHPDIRVKVRVQVS